MKKLLATFIAGIVLGSCTVGMAATGFVYWKRGGSTYMCEGSGVSVFCKETNWKPGYQIAIIPGAIDVSYGGNLIFNCSRKLTPNGNCSYYGR
jgi:hypothetical protein